MPSIEVRPFQRLDREQLAALVNAHIEVVLPGVSVSVNAVLSQLEREPEEAIVDPWAWLVFWPGDDDAADALAARAVAVMERWGVRRMYADGALPAPGLYGVPDVWPHVRGALMRAEFAPGERIEAILVADVADLPRGAAAPLDGLIARREIGRHATLLDRHPLGTGHCRPPFVEA